MKKYFLVLFIALAGFGLFAQKYAKIRVNEVIVKMNGQEFKGEGVTIPVEVSDKTPAHVLFSGNGVKITVAYKLMDMKSGRSDHKETGIRFKIKYKCEYNGKTENRMVERMFFLNDKREFDEKDYFAFNDKIKTTKIEFRYTGILEE
jgi:hypothetical protein